MSSCHGIWPVPAASAFDHLIRVSGNCSPRRCSGTAGAPHAPETAAEPSSRRSKRGTCPRCGYSWRGPTRMPRPCHTPPGARPPPLRPKPPQLRRPLRSPAPQALPLCLPQPTRSSYPRRLWCAVCCALRAARCVLHAVRRAGDSCPELNTCIRAKLRVAQTSLHRPASLRLVLGRRALT